MFLWRLTRINTAKMNIFILDEDITKSAQYHCDNHCGKMILESAQLIASVLHNIGAPTELLPLNKAGRPYGAGYRNHPCAKWAGHSLENFKYLHDLMAALAEEFQYRKGTVHASYTSVMQSGSYNVSEDLFSNKGLTVPANCTLIKNLWDGTDISNFQSWEQAVSIYRRYYLWYKSHLLQYTKRETPYWLDSLKEELDTVNSAKAWYHKTMTKNKPKTVTKRKTKSSIIQELPPHVVELIPNLEKLTIAQLEGVQQLAELHA